MSKESLTATAKKSLITILIKELWPIFPSLILSGLVYFYSSGGEIVSYAQYNKWSLILLAVLLGTAFFFSISWIRLYLRYKKYTLAVGVLRDKKYNINCISCPKLLKHSSHGNDMLFCSDVRSNNKPYIKDDNANPLTKHQAVYILKNC